MNVRTLCLSILYDGDATGYEIRRLSVEGECAYFVEASFGSIYPALARLDEEGMVTSRVEPQEGKPSRKVYSITDAGRAEFVQALQAPLEEDVYRSPFLLFARFAHLLPAELVEARLTDHMNRHIADQKKFDEMLAERRLLCGRRMGHQLRACHNGGCGRTFAHPYARTRQFGAHRRCRPRRSRIKGHFDASIYFIRRSRVDHCWRGRMAVDRHTGYWRQWPGQG
ncbi:PadR family transcriptional regulator [Devosia algicola]|uniref:PadR family transcriptional regulator n=1 Tax=Devosia algicola TaxID=3026418 RepID=A0ABY7YND5_9HYPH|nr:PadR family transcriptional regulator [Devosia algicola]WDR02825.1 PadR family transcriptional regulator [Devosia algicola]